MSSKRIVAVCLVVVLILWGAMWLGKRSNSGLGTSNNILSRRPNPSSAGKVESPRERDRVEETPVPNQELEGLPREMVDGIISGISNKAEEAIKSRAKVLEREAAAAELLKEAGQPGVCSGNIAFYDRLRSSGGARLAISRQNEHGLGGQVVQSVFPDGKGDFAFGRVEAGVYQIVLYETEGTPGMRIENLRVGDGQVEPIVFGLQDCHVTVRVHDEKGSLLMMPRFRSR